MILINREFYNYYSDLLYNELVKSQSDKIKTFQLTTSQVVQITPQVVQITSNFWIIKPYDIYAINPIPGRLSLEFRKKLSDIPNRDTITILVEGKNKYFLF